MNEEQKKLDSAVFEAFTHSVDKQYIYLCDVKTNLWRWSQAAVKTFGLPGEYVQDLPDLWMKKVHPDDQVRVGAAFGDLFSGVTPEHSCEYRVKDADGNYMWVLCKGRLLQNEDDDTLLCAGILTDLGQRNKFDTDTGLYSISQFGIILGGMLLPPDAKGGVMTWGIDNFRHINGTEQYTFGTEMLHTYAEQLIKTFPDIIFYRLESDQFAVICPDADEAALQDLFDKIADVGKNGLQVAGKTQNFSISGGAILYPEHGNHGEDLYPKLEYALECAKKQYRGKLTFYSNSLHTQSLYMFQMQQSLSRSVQNDFEGFSLCFQPIISADKHDLIGAEALLRWSNPQFPLVGPDIFIPILEQGGEIHAVGKWVLSKALEQVSQWHKILPEMRISVNVSYLQMQDSSFQDFVLEEIERQHFPKELLVLELTESCNIVNVQKLSEDLDYFRQNGIQIALDDFGTGYASLGILRDVATDWVKVDQTFVAQIANNDFDKALTQYLIVLCNKLGLKVCVEGIETAEIQSVIEGFNPDTLQGYFYSRPVDAKTFEEKFIRKSIDR